MKCVSAILLAGCVLGAAADDFRAELSPELVFVGPIAAATIHPGDTTTVVIPVMVADGYHVQANPASDEFLIPLELDLQLQERDSTLTWRVAYPSPVGFLLEGAEDSLLTYHGAFSLKLEVSARDGAGEGKRLLTGQLHYQACDAKRCYFPASVPVTVRASLKASQ